MVQDRTNSYRPVDNCTAMNRDMKSAAKSLVWEVGGPQVAQEQRMGANSREHRGFAGDQDDQKMARSEVISTSAGQKTWR